MLIRQMRQNKVIFEVIVFSILNKSFKSEPYLLQWMSWYNAKGHEL